MVQSNLPEPGRRPTGALIRVVASSRLSIPCSPAALGRRLKAGSVLLTFCLRPEVTDGWHRKQDDDREQVDDGHPCRRNQQHLKSPVKSFERKKLYTRKYGWKFKPSYVDSVSKASYVTVKADQIRADLRNTACIS